MTQHEATQYKAKGADLAEYYMADGIYDKGTVLMFGGNLEVTIAEADTMKVAGVVTDNPALAMNMDCGGTTALVALQGRVHCKVKGNTAKGDLMISAGSGYARACNEPEFGQVIGKSLEDFTGDEGMIEVVVGRL